jgi:hypothetical protein
MKKKEIRLPLVGNYRTIVLPLVKPQAGQSSRLR